MTLLGYALYFAALTGLAWALTLWMTRVYAGTLPRPLSSLTCPMRTDFPCCTNSGAGASCPS